MKQKRKDKKESVVGIFGQRRKEFRDLKSR